MPARHIPKPLLALPALGEDLSPSSDDKLHDEEGRLAALARYELLDSPRESEFDEITSLVKSIFGVPMVAISLVDRDRQWFKSRQGLDLAETARDVAFCDHTIRERAVLDVPDARADPRFAANPLVCGAPGIRAYLGAPLTTPDGYNIGSLCILSTEPRSFTASEAALLRKFAGLVVSQIELRQIAMRDGLTGALTRGAFEDVAQSELARYRRHGTPACLAILDLDHFKAINDTHGHKTGDAVLRHVVAVAASVMREADSIGRIGGEEFAIIVTGARVPDALRAVERVRATIEAARLPDRPDIAFTASFGLAGASARYGSATDWLAAADEALYAAKRAGRNRCISAPPPDI